MTKITFFIFSIFFLFFSSPSLSTLSFSTGSPTDSPAALPPALAAARLFGAHRRPLSSARLPWPHRAPRLPRMMPPRWPPRLPLPWARTADARRLAAPPRARAADPGRLAAPPRAHAAGRLRSHYRPPPTPPTSSSGG
jgi:hypothetical protein